MFHCFCSLFQNRKLIFNSSFLNSAPTVFVNLQILRLSIFIVTWHKFNLAKVSIINQFSDFLTYIRILDFYSKSPFNYEIWLKLRIICSFNLKLTWFIDTSVPALSRKLRKYQYSAVQQKVKRTLQTHVWSISIVIFQNIKA